MSSKVNKNDLERGIIECESCGCQITLANYERLSVQKCPSCGHPNFIPAKISTYWLYQPLGGGGMGRVYKALSVSESGDFAVKLLHGATSHDNLLVENLIREAAAGKALGRHKNIIPVIEYGKSGDDFFIVSEFSEGERLDNLLISRKRFDEKEAWLIALQIIGAEMHILSKGYFFRDLKPENIMIDKNSVLRLYDYGLCLTLEQVASGGLTHSEHIEGSPFYLPPERVLGAPEGEYSEIYSLGMVVFHMLTGKTYYSKTEITDLISKHVTSLRISSVESQLRHCSKKTIEIVDKMIKRHPNDRYHNFVQLKAEIEELVPLLSQSPKSQQITAPPGALSPVIKRNKIKNVRILTIGLFAIFAILLGILIFRTIRDARLKKEAVIKISASLGIPPDIKAPAISHVEIKKQIEDKLEENLKEFKAQLPRFNEAAAEKESRRELGIKNSPKSPVISIAELEKKRLSEIKEKERKLIESLSNEHKFDENSARNEIIKRTALREPLPKSNYSLRQAVEKFEQHTQKMAEEKFSDKERDLARRKTNAHNENRPFRRGEIIETVDASGRPVRGTFDGRSGVKVIIGGREILLRDIPVTQRFRFDEALADKRTREILAKLRDDFESEKKKYRENIAKKEKEQFLKNLGFIKYRGKYMPAEDYLNQELRKMRRKNEDELKKKISEKTRKIPDEMSQENYYKKHGFCKYQGKWVPEKEALHNSIEDKRKKFESENEKKVSNKKKLMQPELEKRIYTANSYIFYHGAWQPAKDLLDRLVKIELLSQ